MHKLWIALFLLLATGLQAQQPAGFSAIKDEKGFRENFSKAGQGIQTIKSDFVQEKNLSLLEEKIVSKGQFFFKKEKKVRLEYSTPYKYLMVINGDDIAIQDDKKVNRMSAKSNKMFRQINEIIVDCLAGTALSNPNYQVQPFENKTQYALLLTPKSKTLREFFSTILVFVDRKDYTVARVDLNELSGDTTVMRFSQQVLNQPLPESTFVLKN
ncbi:MAG: outer membrane lipoprotein carrier protein LolA [Saprospiraceae bacterium]|nr:outer membrane lipoprotein carrier protein LolA [Saprospiraceae bacterium]